MDIYADRPCSAREAFLSKLGLPQDARFVLVAAYADRLGQHEPALCRALQAAIGRATLAPARCSTFAAIRSTASGVSVWAAANPPTSIVEPPDLGALDHLTNLIRHAEVVIASAGTINLDAVALIRRRSPSRSRTQVPYYDRASRRYDMETWRRSWRRGHAGGEHDELISAVRGYMADRTFDAAGRESAAGAASGAARRGGIARIATAIGHFARDHETSHATARQRSVPEAEF